MMDSLLESSSTSKPPAAGRVDTAILLHVENCSYNVHVHTYIHGHVMYMDEYSEHSYNNYVHEIKLISVVFQFKELMNLDLYVYSYFPPPPTSYSPSQTPQDQALFKITDHTCTCTWITP